MNKQLILHSASHLGFLASEWLADVKEVDSILEGERDDVFVEISVVVGEGFQAAKGNVGHLERWNYICMYFLYVVYVD